MKNTFVPSNRALSFKLKIFCPNRSMPSFYSKVQMFFGQ